MKLPKVGMLWLLYATGLFVYSLVSTPEISNLTVVISIAAAAASIHSAIE